MDGSGPIGYCCYHLTQGFGTNITYGIDALQIGPCRLDCLHVAVTVQIKLTGYTLSGGLSAYAYKGPIARKKRFFSSVHIFELDARQFAVVP